MTSHLDTTSDDAAFAAIRDFLAGHAGPAAGPITRDTELLAGGLLDSLGILQLMEFLGEQLAITVDDDDFVPENFETVAKLLAFIDRKRR